MDWSAFVELNLFEQVLLSAIGVPITYWLSTESLPNAKWLVLDPYLTIVCFYCAFMLVWKMSVEEHESSEASEMICDYLPQLLKVMDLILVVPYLFLVFLLPFFSVAYQFFIISLVAFYLVWIGYGWLTLKAVALYDESVDRPDSQAEACPVENYFKRRQTISSACLAVVILGASFSWYFTSTGSFGAVLIVGFVSVSMIIVAEGIVEPIINFRFHYEDYPPASERIEMITVDQQMELDGHSVEALKRIHNEAFPPEEQKMSINSMLEDVGSSNCFLRAVRLDGAIIGYLFFEVRISSRLAFLWYFAIDKRWRSQGIGEKTVHILLTELENWPTPIRYALLECRSPTPSSDQHNWETRRIKFYRRLGAYWLRGLEYRVPSATDPTTTFLSYDVMLFCITKRVRRREIAAAVMEMAEPLGKKQPGIYQDLQRSLSSLIIQSPPANRENQEVT